MGDVRETHDDTSSVIHRSKISYFTKRSSWITRDRTAPSSNENHGQRGCGRLMPAAPANGKALVNDLPTVLLILILVGALPT